MKVAYKWLRCLAKAVMPSTLVNWIKSNPVYELYGMRNSSLGVPFQETNFPEDTKRVCEDFSQCLVGGRTAIFAMYSGNGRISDSVVYYLKGLSNIVDNIVFIGDCPIFPCEVERIRPYVNHCEFVRHGEYDFGSYKRGWQFVRSCPELNSITELVLCNDSCYGPVVPFEFAFEKMMNRQCDFWGMCRNDFYKSHIQSYFIVLKGRVLRSPILDEFFSAVKRERSVCDVIIRYEIGLTQYLIEKGFKGEACFEKQAGSSIGENPTLHPIDLIEQGCPLLKVKALHDKECNLDGIERTLKYVKVRNPILYDILSKD